MKNARPQNKGNVRSGEHLRGGGVYTLPLILIRRTFLTLQTCTLRHAYAVFEFGVWAASLTGLEPRACFYGQLR